MHSLIPSTPVVLKSVTTEHDFNYLKQHLPPFNVLKSVRSLGEDDERKDVLRNELLQGTARQCTAYAWHAIARNGRAERCASIGEIGKM